MHRSIHLEVYTLHSGPERPKALHIWLDTLELATKFGVDTVKV